MTEVILNDECMHCNDKECHNGYHFCNEAMKDNSFYKNARLYKGLEVIKQPTYEELEKENTELKARLNAINLLTPELQKRSQLKTQQLTKAKELLKMVLDWQYRCGNGHPTWQEVCAKIEQFLSEDSTYERIQKAKYNYTN